MSLPLTRVLPGTGLTSIMALALMLVMALLATTQAAPPHSLLQQQDHTLPLTELYTSGKDILDVHTPDKEVEQLLALKNHRTNPHLYKTSILRENKKPQERGLKTERSTQMKSVYDADTPLSYFLKDLKQGQPFHQTSSRVPNYTASDLAEYIYKTGDEDGVSLALQELTKEGLMSPEEGLIFLHDVRKNLEYLIQEEKQNKHGYQEDAMKDLKNKSQLSMGLPEMLGRKEQSTIEIDNEDQLSYSRDTFRNYSDKDYSLEEVIYQLAKLLFAQTQQRDGSDGSEKMMDLVIDLLDQETQEGKITPEAHDKALDVMMSSLVEVVKENELSSRYNVTYSGSYPAYTEAYPAYSRSKPATIEYNPFANKKKKPKKKSKPFFTRGSNLAFSGSNLVTSGTSPVISGSKPAFSGSNPAYSRHNTAIGGSLSAFSRINPAFSGSEHAYSGTNLAYSGANFSDSSVHQKLFSFNYPKVQKNDNKTSQKDIKENEEIDV